MKTILITGGAGFIGSQLGERMLLEGNKVIVIDNFNNYYDPELKRKNIEDTRRMCLDNNISINNYKIYEGDFRDTELLNEVFLNKIDCVVHLAACTGVRPSIEAVSLYYDVNVTGTLNILEKCRESNVKQVIFASSSSVYGNNKKIPFSEDDRVDNPISPYAATKKSGELLCYTYHHLYDINVICLRFFTVYGPRQRPDLAINKFITLINENKEIPVYGNGTTARDYTYIDDIVSGIVLSINYLNNKNKVFDIFNLGGDRSISLSEMIIHIEKALGKEAKINRLPLQQGDVERTCADISYSKKMLGYKPKTSFEDGIRKFIDWKASN